MRCVRARRMPIASVVLRHTLMHPFLLDDGNGSSYLGGYFEFLDRLLTALLGEQAL